MISGTCQGMRVDQARCAVQDSLTRRIVAGSKHRALWLRSTHRAYRAPSSRSAYMAKQAPRCDNAYYGPVRICPCSCMFCSLMLVS